LVGLGDVREDLDTARLSFEQIRDLERTSGGCPPS
jgi:hypothetical protein